MTARNGPVLIELEESGRPGPDAVPPVPEPDLPPEGRAMTVAARFGARRASRLGRWFAGLLGATVGFAVSLWAWNAVSALIARSPLLGYAALALTLALAAVALLVVLRELAGFARLGRLDRLHRDAQAALASSDLGAARKVVARLVRLYDGRSETAWGRARLTEREGEQLDAETLLGLAETELLAPLDRAARAEIEAAARQVATVTAVVPLALADVAAALVGNVRMIRRIAEIYGGRAGTLGSWRLTRTVLGHLVATGAVAVGDDLIGSVAGGGLISKVSRRFGEGVVNGALTARVGIAALEVCRPLPFVQARRPKVSGLVQRALTGVFSTSN